MKLTKYLCHVLIIKDMCWMIEFVRLIFIKIVSQVVKRLEKVVIKKILIKKFVIIEKDLDD